MGWDARIERIALYAAVLVGALLLGILLDRLAIARIRSAAKRSGWHGGEAATKALAGMLPIWSLLAALWWALPRLDLAVDTDLFLERLLGIALVTSLTWSAARFAGGLVRGYAARSDTPIPSASIFVNITRIAVVAIGLLVGLGALGIEIAPLLTALGLGGLAVALAFQQTLTNLLAGLQLAASGQTHPGDVVRLASGEEGRVEDITWRTTTLRQGSGTLVIVPNSVLASVVASNRGSAEGEHPVTVIVPVPYTFDLARVETLATEVALEAQESVTGAVRKHIPSTRFTAFAETGVTLEVGLRAKTWADRGALRHEFTKRLHRRMAEEGVALTLPEG